jgi:hypothetical protein
VLVSCNEMTAITFILLVKPLAILLANVWYPISSQLLSEIHKTFKFSLLIKNKIFLFYYLNINIWQCQRITKYS